MMTKLVLDILKICRQKVAKIKAEELREKGSWKKGVREKSVKTSAV